MGFDISFTNNYAFVNFKNGNIMSFTTVEQAIKAINNLERKLAEI